MQKANGVIRFHSISDFFKLSGNRCFFWALAPCLLAVLLYCFVNEFPSPFPDSRDYLDLSTSLVEQGRFIHSFEQGSGEYSITRTPGYPALIAIFQLFAGRHGFFILNLLFLYGTCVLTFKLADKFDIHAHKTLIALFVLSPGLITCSTAPLTEVPFCFWLMATLYLLTCDRFITAGLCLSMATFIRPAGILLFIIIALWILFKKKKVVYALLFAAAANVFPVGWSLRNYSHFGHYTYTTLSGHYLLHYKAGSYLSWRDDIPFDLMRKQLDAQLESSHPIERDKEAGQLGRKILLDNFMGFCLWTPRNLIYFMMPDITPLFERLQMVSGNRGTLDILRRKGLFPAIRHYFSGNA
ncbi:MAG: hypothetical protein JXR78_13450, partial [Victivallales bacterium]|nr:hypothetical protein [Victivallales bacterium]